MYEHKKHHKDMLGRTLMSGQIALHVFIPEGQGCIDHRLCKIIKINSNNVRIKYDKEGKEHQSNIYLTTKRLVILKMGNGCKSSNINTINNRWEILDL